ncbi:MAG: hypothetical protein ACKOUQ_09700, partial [Aquirufa sp.]
GESLMITLLSPLGKRPITFTQILWLLVKFLALHRTAPIGTLVLVKNLTYNQSIWVKVIGRLPNGDSKVIIKLSPKAFEKLNAVDKRVRAEISYLLQ